MTAHYTIRFERNVEHDDERGLATGKTACRVQMVTTKTSRRAGVVIQHPLELMGNTRANSKKDVLYLYTYTQSEYSHSVCSFTERDKYKSVSAQLVVLHVRCACELSDVKTSVCRNLKLNDK